MLQYQEVSKLLSKLPSGSMVIVEVITPAGQKVKFKSCFIGFMPDKFVLIQTPDLNKNRKLASVLLDSSKCTLRGLSEGQEGAVVAFNSVIKSSVRVPGPMMVLQIPETVAIQPLRKVNRIDTSIEVDIQIDKYHWQGTIDNISSHGCLLRFNKTQNIDIEQTNQVELTITDSQYNDVDDLNATICNIKNLKTSVSIGVEFCKQSKRSATRLLNQVLL